MRIAETQTWPLTPFSTTQHEEMRINFLAFNTTLDIKLYGTLECEVHSIKPSWYKKKNEVYVTRVITTGITTLNQKS